MTVTGEVWRPYCTGQSLNMLEPAVTEYLVLYLIYSSMEY
jgi:hypothetical protein